MSSLIPLSSNCSFVIQNSGLLLITFAHTEAPIKTAFFLVGRSYNYRPSAYNHVHFIFQRLVALSFCNLLLKLPGYVCFQPGRKSWEHRGAAGQKNALVEIFLYVHRTFLFIFVRNPYFDRFYDHVANSGRLVVH